MYNLYIQNTNNDIHKARNNDWRPVYTSSYHTNVDTIKQGGSYH